MPKLNNLTEERLVGLYKTEKKSLEDIAQLYKVSRTAIHKKLKKYGINRRSGSEARIEAQKQGKLPQQFFDINENFFSIWSVEMAYVLGLIITDGCITKNGTVSLCINDKELLEKVKKVMGAQHNISLSKHQKGLYQFYFTRAKLTKRCLGMPKRTIYKQRTKNGWSYMFVYDHNDSIKLYKILYKNAQNRLFLDRKN